MVDVSVPSLTGIRALRPWAIADAAAARVRAPSLLGPHGKLMVIAADHPARGALRVGDDPLAMGGRKDLLERLSLALSRPGVNGILGTPDVIEDLLLLGALDGKVVFGSMNRGGLTGTTFEIDDRFTAYDARSLKEAGYDGGKMLIRIDPKDHSTVATLQACARAVSELAREHLIAMVEPFAARRADGRVVNDLSPEAMIHAISVANGLGTTSAYTWLKVPVVKDMERVMAATTLPSLILGGEVSANPDVAYASWREALKIPSVMGLVIGRSLLYPSNGDIVAAVDTVVGLL